MKANTPFPRTITFVIVMALWPGCSRPLNVPDTMEQWLTAVADHDLPDRQRLKWIDTLLNKKLSPDDHNRLAHHFAPVLRSSRHSPVIRHRVIIALGNLQSKDTPLILASALNTTREPHLRRQLIHAMAHLNDERVLPDLIRALAENPHQSPVETSLISQTIQAISSQPIENVLADHLSPSHPLNVRLAALSSLVKTVGKKQTLSILNPLDPDDPFAHQLNLWARQFDYIPTTLPRWSQCQQVSSSLTPDQWEKLRTRAQQITEKYSYQFDCRDSYLLLNLPESLLDLSPQELIRRIRQVLDRLDHTHRPPAWTGSPDDKPQDFLGQCNLLPYTELLSIYLLLETLQMPEKINQITAFLNEDIAQTDSEIAGLCFLEQSSHPTHNPLVRFIAYPPTQESGDHLFLEPPKMTLDALFSLCRWHCHSQNKNETSLAGPGLDDIRYGAYHNAPMLIVAALNGHSFNVDYLTPEGIVIDLGNYSQPLKIGF